MTVDVIQDERDFNHTCTQHAMFTHYTYLYRYVAESKSVYVYLTKFLRLPSTAVVRMPVKKATRFRPVSVQMKMYRVKTSSQLCTPTNS